MIGQYQFGKGGGPCDGSPALCASPLLGRHAHEGGSHNRRGSVGVEVVDSPVARRRMETGGLDSQV